MMTRDNILSYTNLYALIGMSGAGKSTIGRLFAEKIGYDFFDSDAEIERVAGGMRIPDIFEKYGEAEFRRIEKEVLLDLVATRKKAVISTGGGAMMTTEVADAIFHKACSIWLKISEPVLWERQRQNIGARPMLLGEDPRTKLQSLLKIREPVFAMADITINEDQLTATETVDLICSKIKES